MPFDEDVTVRVFDSDQPDTPLVGEWRGITLSGVPNQIHEIDGVDWHTVSWSKETNSDAVVFVVNATCQPPPSPSTVEASAVEAFNQGSTVEASTIEAFRQVADVEAPEPGADESRETPLETPVEAPPGPSAPRG